MMQTSFRSVLYISALFCLASFILGCRIRLEDSVVIYSAADREYAEPILAGFTRRNEGVEIAPVFDVESTKTVGLVSRIEAEANRPRCDVFWNNEIMHTLRLQKAGMLQPIAWQTPSGWPSDMRSVDSTWLGIAARARILLINREILPADGDRPNSVMDLANPKWQKRCAIADPVFGTTATHFALLHATLGADEAMKFFEAVRKNAVVVAGNKQVAQLVSSGQVAFGLTDTDDALIEIDSGLPVDIVFPDQGEDQFGTARIPNTIAVLKGAPHPKAAAKLANYLASEDTEGRLAMGPSGQFPIRPGHAQESRALKGQSVRWMKSDFAAAAEVWPELNEALRMFRTK